MGGISSTTPNNIVYGTDGFITVGAVDMGATEGEIKVEWEIKQYYPDLAQARGPVAGTGRTIEGSFKVMVKLTEWQYATLSTIIGSYGNSSTATSEKYGGGTLGTITEVSNVVVTGITRNDTKAFRVTIPISYVELGGVSLDENKETVLDVTFNGLYTTAAPKTLPGYIEIAR